ncbi:fibronectin type III domain-containing protein [Paenibacillus sp. 481]|uniref:fibronectin type III domain-containing protein n=1 Tax=Paenibacillus sp. 481 TaxID=2835869 RepID=UPI001E4BF0F9|nr:fibronectin type III domain-containing protein [Paenibacillus sp. 481]UHA74834.1 fibronectin type III domain-containing protein [Paenibacillus sp. 481]
MKLKFFSGLFLTVMLISLVIAPTTYALTIGERLTAPESGWKRYDDRADGIKYLGSGWTNGIKDNRFYDKTNIYSHQKDASIQFDFTGTDIRIIATRYLNHSKNIGITIDGVTESYSAYKNVSMSEGQILVYEKRGLPNTKHTVTIQAVDSGVISLDAIDMNETGELIDYKAEDLTAQAGDKAVKLNWTPVADAAQYVIKYGTAKGNYTESTTVTSSVYGNYTVTGLNNGTTYYFAVSAIVNGLEYSNSNEAVATPKEMPKEPEKPEPTGNRALVEITLINGTVKEYDLSMKEVEAFLKWFDTKDAGQGPSKFAINKGTNNKGPFSSRVDYVIFDRILTFEINEYVAQPDDKPLT